MLIPIFMVLLYLSVAGALLSPSCCCNGIPSLVHGLHEKGRRLAQQIKCPYMEMISTPQSNKLYLGRYTCFIATLTGNESSGDKLEMKENYNITLLLHKTR
eukprot:sb/3478514/